MLKSPPGSALALFGGRLSALQRSQSRRERLSGSGSRGSACTGGRGAASHWRDSQPFVKLSAGESWLSPLGKQLLILVSLFLLRESLFPSGGGARPPQSHAPVAGSLGAKPPTGAGIPPRFPVCAGPVLGQHRANMCFPPCISNN